MSAFHRNVRSIRIGWAYAFYTTVYVRTSEHKARRVGGATNAPLAKLFALAYNIDRAANPPKPRPKRRAHYEIISPLVKEPIGCTEDKRDVLAEEPDATFIRVSKKNCRSCRETR